ncbi:MAG: helix-hairpin-helix domain-containing protein [Syntrophobacterales bacterium]|nr:helix-hairpin-helix domain-containing protein [Syntrophobacterales bacterium]
MSENQFKGAFILLLIAVFLYISQRSFHCYHTENAFAPHSNEACGSLVVQLEGDKNNSGIYFLPEDSSGYDLLAIAGVEDIKKFDEKDLTVKLRNGSKIILSSNKENHPYFELEQMKATTRFVLGMPIEVNRATSKDLELIPGIGNKTAGAIIAYREKIGGFNTINEISKILREKRLMNVAKYLCIEKPSFGNRESAAPLFD